MRRHRLCRAVQLKEAPGEATRRDSRRRSPARGKREPETLVHFTHPPQPRTREILGKGATGWELGPTLLFRSAGCASSPPRRRRRADDATVHVSLPALSLLRGQQRYQSSFLLRGGGG